MSVTPAKVLLDKINTLYRSMSLDTNNINAIERDLMLSYIRQLYESFLMNDPAPAKQVEKAVVKEEVPKVEKQIEIPVVKPVESVTKPVVPPPAREDKSLVVEFMPKSGPKPTSTPPPPVRTSPVAEPVQELKPEPPAPQPEPVQPEAPKASPAPPVTFNPVSFSGSEDPKITSLFANEKAADLSSKLAESSIPDIRKSMGINDRLLVIKELFGGENQVFEDAVGILNNLSGFEEAQQYIIHNLIHRYRWATDDKKAAARDFIKLVRRRYK
jgi:hypothetical protein